MTTKAITTRLKIEQTIHDTERLVVELTLHRKYGNGGR
jgi:hypothetical protein